MQEVAMQIVDVYHIGLQSIHLTQECLGSMRRRQTVTVKETSHQSVPSHTGLIANGQQMGGAGTNPIPSTAVSHIALPAIGHSQIAYLLHDTTSGSVGAQHRIYLK